MMCRTSSSRSRRTLVLHDDLSRGVWSKSQSWLQKSTKIQTMAVTFNQDMVLLLSLSVIPLCCQAKWGEEVSLIVMPVIHMERETILCSTFHLDGLKTFLMMDSSLALCITIPLLNGLSPSEVQTSEQRWFSFHTSIPFFSAFPIWLLLPKINLCNCWF